MRNSWSGPNIIFEALMGKQEADDDVDDINV
jgi:hypothetical protein